MLFSLRWSKDCIQSYLPKNNESGQGLLEYALIVLFIAVAVIAVLGAVGVGVVNVLLHVSDFFSSVT